MLVFCSLLDYISTISLNFFKPIWEWKFRNKWLRLAILKNTATQRFPERNKIEAFLEQCWQIKRDFFLSVIFSVFGQLLTGEFGVEVKVILFPVEVTQRAKDSWQRLLLQIYWSSVSPDQKARKKKGSEGRREKRQGGTLQFCLVSSSSFFQEAFLQFCIFPTENSTHSTIEHAGCTSLAEPREAPASQAF